MPRSVTSPSRKPWRRRWHPTPVLLPGIFHGRRSPVGCSPWGRKESDMTERLPSRFSLSCIGEGNGNPLQCSCLENSRDGGAWWAAVCGVAQSRTRLKCDLAARKPSKFYSFQAKCEFFILDRDMEMYQSREAEDLFLSPGVR